MTANPFFYGAPGRIRTCDLRIRSPALYPTELQARMHPSLESYISQMLEVVNKLLNNQKFTNRENFTMQMPHEKIMHLALEEAGKARQKKEIPVGAVLVSATGEIMAKAHNQTVGPHDPTGHAEILTIREAAQKIKNYRLLNTILYVTIEPCVMCMGAIIHARITRVVYGASDPKWGSLGSVYNFAEEKKFNHHPEIVAGICEQQCRLIMQTFFKERRL